MSLNTVKVPTVEQLSEVATELGFTFTDADLADHHECLLPAFEAYNRLDRMVDELPPTTYPRLPGRRPLPEETATAPGMSKPRSRGAAPASLRTRRSRSRTISASPACR